MGPEPPSLCPGITTALVGTPRGLSLIRVAVASIDLEHGYVTMHGRITVDLPPLTTLDLVPQADNDLTDLIDGIGAVPVYEDTAMCKKRKK